VQGVPGPPGVEEAHLPLVHVRPDWHWVPVAQHAWLAAPHDAWQRLLVQLRPALHGVVVVQQAALLVPQALHVPETHSKPDAQSSLVEQASPCSGFAPLIRPATAGW